jgi:hypothetical protein
MDLNAIRQRLSALQTSTNKTGNLWKPDPGQQVVRIVPYIHNKANPFMELYFHYGLAGKNYLSPISFGRPDPVVEFAEKLKSTGDKNDWQMARKLEPKMRTYVPVIIRGKESEGVKFWGFGKTVYQELLGIIADPDYGDITDPVNGRDISVTFTTAEEAGKSFPQTAIRVKPNVTPAATEKAIIEKIGKQQSLTEIFKEPSYDDLRSALEKWLNPENQPDGTASEESEAPAAKSNKSAIAKDAPTVSKAADVGEAFDALFKK